MENTQKLRRFTTLVSPDRLKSSDIGDLSRASAMAYSGVIQQEEAAATVVLKVTGCEEAGDPSLTSARTLKLRPQHPALVGRVCRSRQKVDSFNVIFDSKVLSRQHAVMSYEGGKFLLKV